MTLGLVLMGVAAAHSGLENGLTKSLRAMEDASRSAMKACARRDPGPRRGLEGIRDRTRLFGGVVTRGLDAGGGIWRTAVVFSLETGPLVIDRVREDAGR
ncbi:MAG: hypothetical protein ABWY11_11945 [Umezawaea sp.]